ncbi:GNAT family N-acetyltransferase [Virgibacillus doumboii]|uniref:GNAT family N-acetyltransferase n=1 Tax=Virgibacillus doumboii TaxID=2697503 RepID=UPI0013DFFF06|nr:GNAT family N-acetyltransferase [Virgibacillus doumboii]
MMEAVDEINFAKISKQQQNEAKDIILEGFRERFGFIDYSLNPDLENIYANYTIDGNAFFVGLLHHQIICTGAITKENPTTARIERMSVKKEFRRQGIARKMLLHLENCAKDMGYSQAVMETNKKWTSAINLYKNNGYAEYKQDNQRIHMFKTL